MAQAVWLRGASLRQAMPDQHHQDHQPHQRRPRRAGRHLDRRNSTVERHLPLVRPIATHYAHHCSEARDDLEQVGLMGLIRAAELFDAQAGTPFSAYARRHIRGAILHYLRDTAPMVRTPRRHQERQQRLTRLSEELDAAFGRAPRSEELRRALGLSERQWSQTQLPCGRQRLWLGDDQFNALSSQAATEPAAESGVLMELRRLEPRQRRVVQAVVLQGRSLRDVAHQQGTSAATVHRLLHRGLRMLRSRLTDPSDVPAC